MRTKISCRTDAITIFSSMLSSHSFTINYIYIKTYNKCNLDSTVPPTNIPKHRRLSSRVSASDNIVENLMKSLDLEENQKPLAIRAALSSHNEEKAAKQWINEHKNDIDANKPVTEIFKYKIQTEIEKELITTVTSKIDEKHLYIPTQFKSKMEESKSKTIDIKVKEIINEMITNWNLEIIEPFNNNELLKNECYISHEITININDISIEHYIF